MLLDFGGTDLLSLVTAEACDVDIVVNYIDRDNATGAVGAATRITTNITTATTTTIVDPPVSGTARKILSLTIRNAHASTSVDVLIQEDPNGNGTVLYEIHAARLYPTQMLQWDQDKGFAVSARRPTKVFSARLYVDHTGIPNVGTSLVDAQLTNARVSELGVKVPTYRDGGGRAQKFGWFAALHAVSAATTTGVKPGLLNSPGATSVDISACIGWNTASVSNSVHHSNAATFGTTIAVGTSVTGADGCMTLFAGGMLNTDETASGQGDIGHSVITISSEVAASQATIRKGSWFTFFEDTEN